MIAGEVNILSSSAGGRPRTSSFGKCADIFDPSTGEVIAQAPLCTQEEVDQKVDTWDGVPGR